MKPAFSLALLAAPLLAAPLPDALQAATRHAILAEALAL